MVLPGPGGYLVVEGGTNALPVVYSVLGGVRGGGTRVDGPKPERHRMAYEFAEFARIIAERRGCRGCSPDAHHAGDGTFGRAAREIRRDPEQPPRRGGLLCTVLQNV